MTDTQMAIDSSKAFARNVATLLEVSGLTHARLAQLCGLPAPRISEMLRGRYGQNLKTVDRVCRAFNQHYGAEVITPDMLIAEDFQVPAKIFAKSA